MFVQVEYAMHAPTSTAYRLMSQSDGCGTAEQALPDVQHGHDFPGEM